MPLTQEERAEAFRVAMELAKQNARALRIVNDFLEHGDTPPEGMPAPPEEEQQILDLFEAGASLTGMQIAHMLGDDCDNGTLRTRLASMVKKGLLVNKRPGGYRLPD